MLARKPGAQLASDLSAEVTAPQASRAPSEADGFEALDLWLTSAAAAGSFAVVVADPAALESVADHVARRLALPLHAGASDSLLHVARHSSTQAALGFRLALASLASLPREAGSVRGAALALVHDETPAAAHTARDLALRLLESSTRQDVGGVVVVDDSPGRFAQSVAHELDGHARRCCDVSEGESGPTHAPVVWVVPKDHASVARATWAHRFEVSSELSRDGRRRWWSALSSRPPRELLEEQSFARIELSSSWWSGARVLARQVAKSGALHGPSSSELAPAARLLLAAARPWPLSRLGALGLSLADVDELVELGRGELLGDQLVMRADARAAGGPSLSPVELERVVSALVSVFPGDPWASMRAAELALSAGDQRQGDDLALAAIKTAVDPDARADCWARFMAARDRSSPSAASLLPFVDAALRGGEGELALKLAREAHALASAAAGDRRHTSQSLLAMGRAFAATGDHSSAVLTLERVVGDVSELDEECTRIRARAWVELAEVRYFASDLARARSAAEQGLALACGTHFADVSIDARNVLGKLLLAEAKFDEAEQHFSRDCCEASLAGLPMAELRARVNRAIACMSLGRRAEAQGMLETVLEDADEQAEPKAQGIALINLAALAILDHRYGDALELSERAVELLRRIGDRVSLARCVANLAELRVRVGLVNEAVQAVRFGSRIFRGGAPAEQAAQFALILGRAALARGDSAAAHQHVVQALASLGTHLEACVQATSPADGALSLGPVREHVSEALRVAARAALDDGDVERTSQLIEAAARERAPARARADLAVLRAQLARARGEDGLLASSQALAAARDADDDELLREAHVLLYRQAASSGDAAEARRQLAAAAVVRDRVSAGLPSELRAAFAARADVAWLSQELAAVSAAQDAPAPWSCAPSSPPSTPPSSLGRAPSQPPSVAGVHTPGGQAARRIVGEDAGVRSLLNAVRKIGPSDTTVLIHGESGTGKELVAEALHEASGRRAGPLVKVNCAALVETLLLSELFGHEKGAFTGAAGRRRGRFEAADGGTLFLDEIGDISPRTQVALLRVLQERTFERVGGSSSIRCNVRVVCATHRDLKAMVQRGEFREDLYYRLCGVVIEVPALRARLSDLGPIADALLLRVAQERGGPVKSLSPRALRALRAHTWPGNVRELENALRAASLFAEGDQLEPSDFAENVESLRHVADTIDTLPVSSVTPSTLRRGPSDSGPVSVGAEPVVGTESASSFAVSARPSADCLLPANDPGGAGADASAPASSPSAVAYASVRSGVSLHDLKRLIERDCIARALGDAGGNITKAATLLGMKRPRLSQLVKQYGLGEGSMDASDNGASDNGDDAAEEE